MNKSLIFLILALISSSVARAGSGRQLVPSNIAFSSTQRGLKPAENKPSLIQQPLVSSENEDLLRKAKKAQRISLVSVSLAGICALLMAIFSYNLGVLLAAVLGLVLAGMGIIWAGILGISVFRKERRKQNPSKRILSLTKVPMIALLVSALTGLAVYLYASYS